MSMYSIRYDKFFVRYHSDLSTFVREDPSCLVNSTPNQELTKMLKSLGQGYIVIQVDMNDSLSRLRRESP